MKLSTCFAVAILVCSGQPAGAIVIDYRPQSLGGDGCQIECESFAVFDSVSFAELELRNVSLAHRDNRSDLGELGRTVPGVGVAQ